MIAPTDHGRSGKLRSSSYTTVLSRPVRGETLLRVLLANHDVVQGQTQLASRSIVAKPVSRPHLRNLSVLISEETDINAMLARSLLIKEWHHVDLVNNKLPLRPWPLPPENGATPSY